MTPDLRAQITRLNRPAFMAAWAKAMAPRDHTLAMLLIALEALQ